MNQTIAYESGTRSVAAPIRVSSQDKRLNLYLWLLLTVTNIVDVLATRRAFEIGIDELNPIVALLYAEYGIGAVAAFKLPFLLLLLFLLPHIRGWTRGLLVLACSAYLALTFAHIWYLSPLL